MRVSGFEVRLKTGGMRKHPLSLSPPAFALFQAPLFLFSLKRPRLADSAKGFQGALISG
jgi:hypothetical protein